MTTDPTSMLSAAATMLEGAGLTLEDLAAHLKAGERQAVTGYPTLADHISNFEAGLKRNTLRTWHTHYRRLLDGVAPQCDCTCDACLDTTTGCACDCISCRAKVAIEPSGDRVLRPKSVTASEVKRWASVAQRLSAKKATADNRKRAAKGLVAKPATGEGGRENAITAYRALFAALVQDELWTSNPAMHAIKTKRSDTVRRGLRDDEIGEFLDTVATGGDDPELDTLLCWFHLETGARRGGALNLTVGRLRRANQTVELFEKGAKLGEQPVSLELLDALEEHAVTRGGPACDRTSDQYDPARPVFYYRQPGARSAAQGMPAPLTSRRYDTLFARIQRDLSWANEIALSAHALRKTGASIVERIAGSQTARLFLRHGRRTTTDTYVESWHERLASAVVVMTGRPHPAAPDTSTRLDS